MPTVSMPVPVTPPPIPPVSKGQIVLWSDGPGSPQEPAVVLKVATGSINVAVHSDMTRDHALKTGVRHAADPWLKAHPDHQAGVWVLTPRDELIDAVLDAFKPAAKGV